MKEWRHWSQSQTVRETRIRERREKVRMPQKRL